MYKRVNKFSLVLLSTTSTHAFPFTLKWLWAQYRLEFEQIRRPQFVLVPEMIPRDNSSSTSQSGGMTGGNSRQIAGGDGSTASGSGVRSTATVRTFGSAVSLPVMEKLKGRQNYASWAFSMKMALIREGTWRAVKPLENVAVDPDMSDRALVAICLSLEKHNFSLVKNADPGR